MKKKLIGILLTLTIVVAVSLQAFAATKYTVTGTKNYLALRNTPATTTTNEIGKLYNGEVFNVESYTNGFAYGYTSGNKYGYVNAQYLAKGATGTTAQSSTTGVYNFQLVAPQNSYGTNVGVDYLKIEGGKLKVSGFYTTSVGKSGYMTEEFTVNSNTFYGGTEEEGVFPRTVDDINYSSATRNGLGVQVTVLNGVVVSVILCS